MTLRKRFIVGLISLHLMMSCTDGNEVCKASIGGHSGSCPPTWKPWGGKCYKAITENLTWNNAKDECLKMGSVLAAPRSEEENQFLEKQAQYEGVYNPFWINCNDLVEGTWKCEGDTGEEVAFRKWATNTNPKQPSGGNEHCGTAKAYSGKWDDRPCTDSYRAVCTMPAPQLHF